MNLISRKILAVGTGLAVLASAAPALAASTLFCTNLSTTISTVNTSMTNLQNKITTARSNRSQTLANNWAKVDSTLTQDRANWNSQRQTEFSALEAKATTDAQKAAVQTYETTITNAINTRESANDAARTTYRNGVQAALNSQNSTIDGQISTFTSAVNAAETTAQNSCAATPTDTSIRTTFIAATKAARQTFVSDRKNDGTIGSQVKSLAATRDAAIKANNATFESTAKAAATTLKAAFTS